MSRPSCKASSIFVVTLLSDASVIRSGDLLMICSVERFPKAVMALQNAIRAHRYALPHVQRIDLDLTRSGHTIDNYRVVLFGKADEIRHITARRPALISYLQLKLAIFTEGDHTLVVGANSWGFSRAFPVLNLRTGFKRWEYDCRAILQGGRRAE